MPFLLDFTCFVRKFLICNCINSSWYFLSDFTRSLTIGHSDWHDLSDFTLPLKTLTGVFPAILFALRLLTQAPNGTFLSDFTSSLIGFSNPFKYHLHVLSLLLTL